MNDEYGLDTHLLGRELEKRDTPAVAPVAPPTEPSAPPDGGDLDPALSPPAASCGHDDALWHRVEQLEMRLDLAELELGKLAGDELALPSHSIERTHYEGKGDEHSESCARLSNLEERMALVQADIGHLKLRAAGG